MADQKKKKYTQTLMEEIANSITHGLGFGFSVAGLTILVVFASMDGDPWRIIAFCNLWYKLINSLPYINPLSQFHPFQN